jgi:uncharacterized protein (TIGR00251 family)
VGVESRITIRLQPRASRSEIVGEREGRVVVRVTAPAVDGRANAALLALVAERAGVAKGAVELVRGAASRDKVVRVEGMSEAALRAALGLRP